MTTLTTTTTRAEAQRALRALDDARARLAAALRDPDADEACIAEALRRARGRVVVLQLGRQTSTSKEGRYGRE